MKDQLILQLLNFLLKYYVFKKQFLGGHSKKYYGTINERFLFYYNFMLTRIRNFQKRIILNSFLNNS